MLQHEILSFTGNLRSLRDFVDLLDSFLKEQKAELYESRAIDFTPMALALAHLEIDQEGYDKLTSEILPMEEKVREEFDGSIELELVEDENTGRRVNLRVTGSGGEKFAEAMAEMKKSESRIRLLYYSALMNLTSIVEWYFSQLLHFYFDKYSSSLGSKDKVFSFEDLKNFGSIEDARAYHVESRVESILRDSFENWIDFLKKRANLSMSYIDEHLNSLVETFLRRNLVVHNAGQVNSIYLSKASNLLTKEISVGEVLVVERDYLDDRIDLFEKNCLLIAFEMWKKLDAGDEERGEMLQDIAFKNLTDGRYTISEALSFFQMNDKGQSEAYILTGQLNYWLSLKRQNRWDEVKPEVHKADFTAKAKIYQLAHASLCEESDTFFQILPSAVKADEINVEVLKAFPIFDEMREDERYQQIVSELMAENLDTSASMLPLSTSSEIAPNNADDNSQDDRQRLNERQNREGAKGER